MTLEVVLLIAAYLSRPVGLVENVYAMGGMDSVAVCEYESHFNDRAWRREYEGTSWGLFQLWSKYHDQHRDDILLHIVAGVSFWQECKRKADGDIARGYSIWNSGSPRKSIAKGREVERLRDRLARRVAEAYGVRE
jgi:hypothetical protein